MSSSVSTHQIKVGTHQVKVGTVLTISATARQGVSAKDVAVTIEQHLHALDQLLGFTVPALIQIFGGCRANVAKTKHAQSRTSSIDAHLPSVIS